MIYIQIAVSGSHFGRTHTITPPPLLSLDDKLRIFPRQYPGTVRLTLINLWEMLFLNLNCSDKNSLEICPVVFFGPSLTEDEVYWKSKTLDLRKNIQQSIISSCEFQTLLFKFFFSSCFSQCAFT